MAAVPRRFAIFAAAVIGLTSSAPAGEIRSCESESDMKLKLRLADIDVQLAKVWARRGPDWITAYDIAGTPRNPFDLNDLGSGVAAYHGYAWLRDVSCAIAEGKTQGTLVVTYTAAAYRFKEGRLKWVEPMTNGAIAEYLLSQNATDWIVKDLSRDETIFLPESAMRMPRVEELPQQKVWPDKRCLSPKIWQGNDCVLAKPKSNSTSTGKPDAG